MNERLDPSKTGAEARLRSNLNEISGTEWNELLDLAVYGADAAGAVLCLAGESGWRVLARLGLAEEIAEGICQAMGDHRPQEIVVCRDRRRGAPASNEWMSHLPSSILSCVGVPLRSGEGVCLGLLLAVRDVPGAFGEEQIARLQYMARQVLRILEMQDLRARRAERNESEAQREERFARAFQVSPDPIAILVRDDATVIDVNDAFLGVFGRRREDVIGRGIREIELAWVEPAAGARVIETVLSEGCIENAEVRVRMRTGRIWLGLISAEAIEIDGRACALMMMKDISEIRRLEEQLLVAQKMDAIGRLAGGIAHDFNNFLTIIHGYSEVLLTHAAGLPETMREPVLEMRAAAERAAGLTRQLLAFSRQQILRLQDVDLNRVILSNERMLRSAVSEQIDLRINLDPVLGRIQADLSQIDQVLLNLVINARDAMPQGGSIRLETDNLQYAQPTVFGRETVPAGRWIRLTVRDTGCGMNDSVQSRIFEPFYTTKEEGKGTGLGLATVYGIIKQTGGYIAVLSTPGAGTTFEVLLPRFDAAQSARTDESSSRSPLIGSETILLVEDEEAIRLLCCEVLEGQGYTVMAASDGQEALRMAHETEGPIHLLVTDVILPRLGGDVLAAMLREQRPGMAVIFISGMSDDLRQMHPEPGEETLLLQKPFSPGRLSRAVRDVLDRVSPGDWVH